MASNREERRLQRQRGAQRHQVQDIDFGSPFPTAAVQQQRITRSRVIPQPDLPSQLSNRRTPAPRGRGSPTSPRSTQKHGTPTPTPTGNDANRSANTSAKRRKLDAPQDIPPSSPARSTQSRSTPHRDLYNLDEEAAAEPAERQALGQTILDNEELGEELDQVQPAETPKPLRITDLSVTRTDEITESPLHAPGSGQRQTDFERSQIPGVRLFETPGEAKPSAKPAGEVTVLSPTLVHRRSPRNHEATSAADEIDELSPDRPSKSRLVFQREQFSDIEAGTQEAEGIDDMEAAEQLQRRRKRKSNTDEVDWEAEEEEFERDEEREEAEQPVERFVKPTKTTKQQKRPRAKASPATQRQPKKPKSKPTSQMSGEIIPIEVHRLTKPITYGEDDTDTDLLNEDVPFARRSGVNAVDVFSQFCEEIIESGLAALEEGGSNAEDPAIRREYRTKLRAVEAFQEELRTRLLELTVILDADYLLNKRVRAAQKERIQLREELLRLRAEREQLALRMDDVRIKHENNSREAREQAALNNSLHDIELAVSRGVEKAPTGGADDLAKPKLFILLKAIAGEISSSSPEGGILKQVKEFNAFLERAAMALEARS